MKKGYGVQSSPLEWRHLVYRRAHFSCVHAWLEDIGQEGAKYCETWELGILQKVKG